MQINADTQQLVIVHAEDLDWTPSPNGEVERKMLERDGDEVARATTIVRYPVGSSFPAHEHALGEEFLVLEGTFSDEHGDFEAGSYVRNPPGTSHAPGSRDGCSILVKLRQMDPSNRDQVSVDTRTATWLREDDGVTRLSLYDSESESVEMVRLEPGASIELDARGGQELFVVEGAAKTTGEETRSGLGATLRTYSWLREPDGGKRRLESDAGCIIYRKSGHLAGRDSS